MQFELEICVFALHAQLILKGVNLKEGTSFVHARIQASLQICSGLSIASLKSA